MEAEPLPSTIEEDDDEDDDDEDPLGLGECKISQLDHTFERKLLIELNVILVAGGEDDDSDDDSDDDDSDEDAPGPGVGGFVGDVLGI